MLRALACLSVCSALLAQDPAARCAEALLRGDAETAAAAAASATDPALRARLQAALLPLPQRPMAMLAVAGRFGDSQEADAAILAAAAAVLAQRDRGRAVPGLMGWIEQEGDEWDEDDRLAVAPVVERLWQALDARVAAGGDAGVLAEARRLLQLCSVSRFGFVPARVGVHAQWQLPERREDLQLRAWRRQPGRSSWEEFDRLGPPQLQVALPQAASGPIDGLSPGDWLLELASARTRWRALRAVEVSDLDVVALVDHGVLALGAWRLGAPADAVDWRLLGNAKEAAGGAFAGGAAVAFPAPAADGDEAESRALMLRSGGHGAWLALPSTRAPELGRDRWQAHLMLDRPLYRPGDTVMGRVLLRRCRFDGDGLDAVATAEPAAGQALTLRAFARSDAEVRLDGRTDAHGVFAFELRVPAELEPSEATFVAEVPGAEQPVGVLYDSWACSVAWFRRPALLVDVSGPTEVQCDAADPAFTVRAHWASGAPAAGIAVTADVHAWGTAVGRVEERHRLVTDGSGAAVLTVALRHLRSSWVRIDFAVEGPDGHREQAQCFLSVRDPAAAKAASDRRDHDELQLESPAIATVGQPCRIAVHGAAGARALLVTGRGRGARAQLLQLDANGDASAEVTPTRAEWPVLDLAVATATTLEQDRVPVQLREPVPPRIDLPARARPGEQLTCRVATGVAGTVVTVAVVDERIFALAADRTRDPDAALRPYVPAPQWGRAATTSPWTPPELLGSLLQRGVVPPAGYGGALDPVGPPSAGAGAAGPSGPDQVRVDFRATAAFVTAVAGGDGVAVLPIPLPDDLTTWRVSVVGVAPDGIGFQERRALVTRLLLAAEPLLPRVLRVGDQVDMLLAIDRAAEAAAAGDVVTWTASSEGTAMAVVTGTGELEVKAGSAATAVVTLRGAAAGETALSLQAKLGEHADASRRTLLVQADAVQRPLLAAALGSGRVDVQTPAGADPAHGLQVTVLGGGSAAWSEIERRLTAYPYGCVEQTLSRLLPYFAAVRGARAHGVPPPAPDAEFDKRLDQGLQRLRQLQHGRGGGFSFWPRGEVDPGMTVLVLHGLSVVREGGVDPAAYGLACDPANALFRSACARLLAGKGAVASADDVLAAELAAACLRSAPGDAEVRATVAACADAGSALPPGLLARMGLALVAAGDRARAERCRQRLEAAGLPAALLPDGFPGDDPLVVQAQRLELVCLLQPDAAGVLAGELLLQCLHGHSTTLAQACALTALALALPRDDAKPCTVQVRAGEVERAVELRAEQGFAARLQLPFAASCTAVGPDGRQLLLALRGERSERASDHASWQAPLLVERALCRQRADATPEQRQNGEDLVPVGDGALLAGEAVWLRVSVRAPVPARYVVVECPLPAGFEVHGEPDWLERFDDRVAFTFGRLDGAAWRAFAVVPTMPGRVVWPPTTAAPMYSSGCDGGSAGAWLTVARTGPGAAGPAAVTCLQQLPAVTTEARTTVYQEADKASDVVHHAFTADAAEPQAAAVDAAFGRLAGLATPGNREEVLGVLTWLVSALRDAVTEAATERRTMTWRMLEGVFEQRTEPLPDAGLFRLDPLRASWLERAVLLQQQTVLAVLADLERQAPERTDGYRIEVLTDALEVWQDAAAKEALLAAVLRIAAGRGQQLDPDLFEHISGPVRDAALRAELLGVLPTAWGQLRDSILALLPRADLASLPPSLLTTPVDREWPEGTVELLLGSAVGRAELRRCLRQPPTLYHQYDALAAQLPAELWREIPLAAYAELDWSNEPEAGSRDAFVGRISRSPIPTAELQSELAESPDLDWRAGLLLALRQRAVRDLGGIDLGDEPPLEWWVRALQLGAGDAAAALQFVLDVRASPTVLAAYGRHGRTLLQELALPIVVGHGDGAQLARVADLLDEAQCDAVFARLDAVGRRLVVGGAEVQLESLPVAADAADCAALWAYGERCDERPQAVRALCRSATGAAFVRGRIDADRGSAEEHGVLAAYADTMGLDEDTLRAPVDQPWLPLLRSVVRSGLQQAGTPAERQLLDQLRAQRGVR